MTTVSVPAPVMREAMGCRVVELDGRPALRLEVERGEARKGTRGLHVEYLRFAPEDARDVGRALTAMAERRCPCTP